MEDNNNNLFDWILDQDLLNTSQQQQPPSEQENTLSPDQQSINNLLFHDWNDIHQSAFVNSDANSNNQQLSGGSSSSTISTTSSNNESLKEQPMIRKQRSSTATLKPFNPHGSTTEPLDNKLQPTTGRLDFRVSNNDDCHVTDSQLKKMTSKERRQLRNKISARNFRQRRKGIVKLSNQPPPPPFSSCVKSLCGNLYLTFFLFILYRLYYNT